MNTDTALHRELPSFNYADNAVSTAKRLSEIRKAGKRGDERRTKRGITHTPKPETVKVRAVCLHRVRRCERFKGDKAIFCKVCGLSEAKWRARITA